jgi:hypothetical protein
MTVLPCAGRAGSTVRGADIWSLEDERAMCELVRCQVSSAVRHSRMSRTDDRLSLVARVE